MRSLLSAFTQLMNFNVNVYTQKAANTVSSENLFSDFKSFRLAMRRLSFGPSCDCGSIVRLVLCRMRLEGGAGVKQAG